MREGNKGWREGREGRRKEGGEGRDGRKGGRKVERYVCVGNEKGGRKERRNYVCIGGKGSGQGKKGGREDKEETCDSKILKRGLKEEGREKEGWQDGKKEDIYTLIKSLYSFISCH